MSTRQKILLTSVAFSVLNVSLFRCLALIGMKLTPCNLNRSKLFFSEDLCKNVYVLYVSVPFILATNSHQKGNEHSLKAAESVHTLRAGETEPFLQMRCCGQPPRCDGYFLTVRNQHVSKCYTESRKGPYEHGKKLSGPIKAGNSLAG
jgi:hypothetical protein